MSDLSPLLALPMLQAAQAQKHVTHNEALMRLDVVVQLAVTDRALASPPVSPADGDRHIVAAGASGLWTGQDGKVALRLDEGWQFISPQTGWRAWVAAEEALATFDGSVWKTAAESPLTVAQLGVSATADGTNRLAVSSDATLFNHAGAGHQVKLNKAAAGDTASLLFQTGFSGRAEMGTAGSDDFEIKVSASGAGFLPALKVAAASAEVTLAKPLILNDQGADPVAPPDGALWYQATNAELRFRTGALTQSLNAQQDIACTVPASGEFVMSTMGTGSAATTLTGALNRIDLYPFVPRATLTIDALGVNCTTAIAAALGKILVYSADALGRPDTLLVETATVDLSTTGNKTAAAGLTLRQGRTYWLGIRHSANPTLSAWALQATPDINGGAAMVTTARKEQRRTLAFATAAPASWGFDPNEINAAAATAVWLRLA